MSNLYLASAGRVSFSGFHFEMTITGLTQMLAGMAKQIISYRRFIRLNAFDQSDEQGQRDERYRRAALSSLTMVVSRAISLLSGIYTVYIMAPALGAERFAILNILITLLSIFGALDFGIPSSVVNRSVRTKAENEDALNRTLVVGMTSIFLIGLLASTVYLIAVRFLPWDWLLSTSRGELQKEAQHSAIWIAPILCIQLVTTGFTNILLGLQKAFISNVITIVVNIIGFLTILIALSYVPSPAGFIWAAQGLSVLTAIVLLFYLRSTQKLTWAISLSNYRVELAHLWDLGRQIFVLNIIMIVSANMDVMLASILLDPASLSELVTTQRLFQVFMGFASVLTMPLWAAYSDAMIKRDHYFIRSTFLRSLLMSSAVAVICLPPVVLFSHSLFSLWTSGSIVPSFTLTSLSAASAALGIFHTAFSFYLIGCQIMRPQFFTTIMFALSNLILKTVFAYYFGVNGLVIGALVAFFITFGLSYGILFKRDVFFWAYPANDPPLPVK